jgi:hypothetical protein
MKCLLIVSALGFALSSSVFAQTLPTTPTQPGLPQIPTLRTQPNELQRGKVMKEKSRIFRSDGSLRGPRRHANKGRTAMLPRLVGQYPLLRTPALP